MKKKGISAITLVESRLKFKKELMEIPAKIREKLDFIEKCRLDIASFESWQKANPSAKDKKGKQDEAEKRKALREFIGSAIKDNILEIKERQLISYCGFDIILPSNMIKEKPYVWLKNNGKYYVELGDKDIGNLIRIDNVLESLPDHMKKLEEGLDSLRKRENDIKAELEKDEDYTEIIELYKNKVKNLDAKLGVTLLL